MAIRYQLDGQDFPRDPLFKRWSRQQIAVGGVGESIYSDFWQIELTFGNMEISDVSFFEGRWLAGGLHIATLAHPQTGVMTSFSGTNIVEFDYEFLDVESDNWAGNPRMLINHISLSATGT